MPNKILKSTVPLLLFPLCATADISDEANACIDELISRYGNVGGEVLGQEFSEAAIMVRLKDGNGQHYECIVWSGPKVADLRPVEGSYTPVTKGDSASAPATQILSGSQIVQFDAGTSGTTIAGMLPPSTSARYVLGARDGQFLTVNVASKGGALDYKIINPDGSLLLDLIASDTPYKGQLWQSGDHIVEVLNAGAQAVEFDVSFGIE